jgi:hypothetical protein
MSNLGPHLRHNRHHTLLHGKEQPYSQFDLHMHDRKPTIYTYIIIFCIILYDLTTCLFIGFTTGKTLNIGARKLLQIHAYHWLQILQITGFFYSRIQVGFTSWPSFGLKSVVSLPHFYLLSIDLPSISSTSTLPDQLPRPSNCRRSTSNSTYC